MTEVLFVISVTGWGLAIAALVVFALGAWQAYLMGAFGSGSGSRKLAGIHLVSGIEYKLRNGNKLKIVDVTARGYHYTGKYNGKEVKYRINNGDPQAAMKSELISFLKENVVTNEIVSEDNG